MKTKSIVRLLVIFLACPIVRAQEPSAPQQEHGWLKQFEGEWESESEATMGPGQEPMKCSGTMSARMLGGLWMVSQSTSEAMGQKVEALQTIGYDTDKRKYVGTWVDSMFNYMWKYKGSVDASGKKLSLDAEGPNFMAGSGSAKFRDSYEFVSPDEIKITSAMQNDKGEWVTFMTGKATRKK